MLSREDKEREDLNDAYLTYVHEYCIHVAVPALFKTDVELSIQNSDVDRFLPSETGNESAISRSSKH